MIKIVRNTFQKNQIKNKQTIGVLVIVQCDKHIGCEWIASDGINAKLLYKW
jgi:hypothetical protein